MWPSGKLEEDENLHEKGMIIALEGILMDLVRRVL